MPGRRYEYRLSSDAKAVKPWSDIYTFTTAPADGSGYRFGFIADTGLIGRSDGLVTGTSQIISELKQDSPLFILGGGDYAYAFRDGRFSEPGGAADAFFSQMQPLFTDIPFIAQFGNHELRLREGLKHWLPRLANPPGFRDTSYSFDVGDVHFTGLLADGYNELDEKLLAWLDNDLASARDKGTQWLIVFQHEPVYGHGTSHAARPEAVDLLAPIFVKHKVDLLLTAHDQSYERTYPLAGDPGAPTIANDGTSEYQQGEGVIYAKISPSGKMSERSFGFSRLPDQLPPFIAISNDTAHHYALVDIDQTGLTYTAFSIAGDGSAKALLDSFHIQRRDISATSPIE